MRRYVLAGDEITTTPISIPTPWSGEKKQLLRSALVPAKLADFISEQHHLLVARIESLQDPMYITETTDINGTPVTIIIAWKNVSVFDNVIGDIMGPVYLYVW